MNNLENDTAIPGTLDQSSDEELQRLISQAQAILQRRDHQRKKEAEAKIQEIARNPRPERQRHKNGQTRQTCEEGEKLMKKRHERTALDAVRLLCNTIQKVQYFDRTGEGFSPGCYDAGELMLQDALEYLSWGDTHNARSMMKMYDEWLETGYTPWPYSGDPPPEFEFK